MSHNNYWPQGSSHNQQRMSSHRGPYGNHSLNPNATAFVPRQNYGQQLQDQHVHQMHMQMQSQMYQNSQYDYHQSHPQQYSNTNMYGHGHMPQQQPPQYATNDFVHAPAMAAYYSDGDLGYDQYGIPHQQQYVASADLQQQYRRSNNNREIQEILVGLEQIIPGGDALNSWSAAIKERMLSKQMSAEGKKLAIQTACEMAEMTPSDAQFPSQTDYQPQYNLARCIAYLSTEVPNLMQQAILPCLEQTHHKLSRLDSYQKANVLVFFAELFVRLESEGVGRRIEPLADAVIAQMKDFAHPANVCDDGMKLLLRVLKIAGAELDTISSAYDDLNTLLSTLLGYVRGHPKLSERIKVEIKDVLDQRSKNWGRPKQTAPSSSSRVYDKNGSLMDLNPEETAFLDQCLPVDQDDETSSQANTNEADTSLDEIDVQQEYDTFINEEQEEASLANMVNGLTVSDESNREETPTPKEDESDGKKVQDHPEAETPKEDGSVEVTNKSTDSNESNPKGAETSNEEKMPNK